MINQIQQQTDDRSKQLSDQIDRFRSYVYVKRTKMFIHN